MRRHIHSVTIPFETPFNRGATYNEARKLLAPFHGDLAACSTDFLLALLAQRAASGAKDLDDVKSDAGIYGRILVSYAESLFDASKAEDAR